MFRTFMMAGLLLAAGGVVQAQAQAPATMAPGQHLQLGPIVGDRAVRQVMIGDSGATVEIVYDTRHGEPRSQRVLRLVNVNGMLEVVYDTTAPTMSVQSGGRVTRVEGTSGGMVEITYER